MKKFVTPGVLAGMVFLSIGLSAQHASNKEGKMSTDQTSAKNKEIIRTLYEECFNTGKLDMVGKFIADEYTGPKGEKGPAGFTQILQPLLSAVPGIHWTIEDLVAEGDLVSVRTVWKGMQTGPFGGFPASQKMISNTAITIFQLRDKKIVCISIETDRLGFLQQTGVLPQDLTQLQKKN